MRVSTGWRWCCRAAILRLVAYRWLRWLLCLGRLYQALLNSLVYRLSLIHSKMILRVQACSHWGLQYLMPSHITAKLGLIPRLPVSAIEAGASTKIHAR